MIADDANRSATTAADGRPLCRTCHRPFFSRRIVINVKTAQPYKEEECQSCKQVARIAKLKEERGW